MQAGMETNQDVATQQGQTLRPESSEPPSHKSRPTPESPGAAMRPAEQIAESSGDDTSIEMGSVLDPDPSFTTSLQVDDDDDNEESSSVSNAKNENSGASNYGTSIYPRVQPSYQVEHPFEHTQDSATIDSSRTLYAEDIDYVWENGRRYCGDYHMPNDTNEQTRQYVLHQAYLKLLDLELTTVPLHNPQFILDVGTGIGEWAIGVAEKYPNCEVFGTDIAAIQPTDQVPFNVEFQIEDAREEWIRPPNSFDLVHFRNMAGAFSDWAFIYQQTFACLKPGGYIEVMDYDDHWATADFTNYFKPGSPIELMARTIRECAELDGRPKTVAHMTQQMLMDAGFVDIHHTMYDLPLGKKENTKFGDDWLFALVTGIEATALRLVTKYKGWDVDYARNMCDAVSRDLIQMAEDTRRGKGFVVQIKVIVGRKPAAPGQWSAQALTEHGEIGDYSGDDSTIGSLSGCRSFIVDPTPPPASRDGGI